MKPVEFIVNTLNSALKSDHFKSFPKQHLYTAAGLVVGLACLFSIPSNNISSNNAPNNTASTSHSSTNSVDHGSIPLKNHEQTITTLNLNLDDRSFDKIASVTHRKARATTQPSTPAQTTTHTIKSTATKSNNKPPQASYTKNISQNSHKDPLNTFTPLAIDSGLTTVKVTVKPGDTLANVFKRAGASINEMQKILQSGQEGKALTKIYPKQVIEFRFNQNRHLQGVSHNKNSLSKHNFDLINGNYIFNETAREYDTRLTIREATIKNSLFLSAKKANMSDKIVMEFANIFGYDVDFALDIREGDSFKALYEEHFLDGKKVTDGNVLAAEFTNKGNTYRAVRYRDKLGKVAYFTPTGISMRKEFLRSPIDFARISSHFNLRRKHPVLNRIRAHKGTDYAAAKGTPIRTAGDGKIIFAGRKGGYGNTMIVKHGQKYKTLYAHISKFKKGMRVGKKVSQGDIIAYVGATGLATGPHLHYEFYVNGAVRNPVTVKLPKASSIAKKDLGHFIAQTSPLLAQISPELIKGKPTQLATSKIE